MDYFKYRYKNTLPYIMNGSCIETGVEQTPQSGVVSILCPSQEDSSLSNILSDFWLRVLSFGSGLPLGFNCSKNSDGSLFFPLNGRSFLPLLDRLCSYKNLSLGPKSRALDENKALGPCSREDLSSLLQQTALNPVVFSKASIEALKNCLKELVSKPQIFFKESFHPHFPISVEMDPGPSSKDQEQLTTFLRFVKATAKGSDFFC